MSAATMGAVLHDADDAPELTTVEGTVVHVAWNPHFEVAVGYEIKNASSNMTYEVELGPPWWWAEVGLPEIEVNDTLRVEGILLEDNVIEAYTIWINGSDPIVIREAGMPAWAQMKSGHADDS